MAKTHKPSNSRCLIVSRSPIFTLLLSVFFLASLYLLALLASSDRFSFTSHKSSNRFSKRSHSLHDKYLYWGKRIDCPGKHCESCEGLGHQESSLRCALEEALVLNRTFVMPSSMCINPIHNSKGILRRSSNESSDENWSSSFCSMESLYDIDLISETVPVILDNSKMWYHVMSTGMKLGTRGVATVEKVSRQDLKNQPTYSNLLLINRIANPLSWFMECKDRNKRDSVALPYSFLPSMASSKLRSAADKIKSFLGDYDAIHVRRGDKVKTRNDRFGVARSLHPHVDRDTRAEFIMRKIEKWVPRGRTIFIASNEKTPGFFSPLSARYRVAYSSNFSSILDSVVENNYQLFMLERLVMMGARKFIKTFKEDDKDLALCDDPKKNSKNWQIPVYTLEENDKGT